MLLRFPAKKEASIDRMTYTVGPSGWHLRSEYTAIHMTRWPQALSLKLKRSSARNWCESESLVSLQSSASETAVAAEYVYVDIWSNPLLDHSKPSITITTPWTCLVSILARCLRVSFCDARKPNRLRPLVERFAPKESCRKPCPPFQLYDDHGGSRRQSHSYRYG